MKTHRYTVTFLPAEEGGYTAIVPALPGCVSEGDTYEEALENIKEAIQAYIESVRKDGLPVPEEISEDLCFNDIGHLIKERPIGKEKGDKINLSHFNFILLPFRSQELRAYSHEVVSSINCK